MTEQSKGLLKIKNEKIEVRGGNTVDTTNSAAGEGGGDISG